VVAVDETSQIQALESIKPILPLQPGIPERQSHDSRRHGATTRFAALHGLTDKVTATGLPRHRRTELPAFLEKTERQTPEGLAGHLILDTQGAHTQPRIEQGLEAHPRYQFPFTPKGAGWLNQAERFLAERTRKCIRRGSFRGVRERERAIREYGAGHNRHARPFVWTPYQPVDKAAL